MKNKYVNTYLSGGSIADNTVLNTVTIETFPDLIKKTQAEIEKLKKLYPKGPIYTKALEYLDLILGEIRELQKNTEFQSEAGEIETSLNAARGLIEAKKQATESLLAGNAEYLKIQSLSEALNKLNTTIAKISEFSKKANNGCTNFKVRIDRLEKQTKVDTEIFRYYSIDMFISCLFILFFYKTNINK
jgi:DNA repair ATPase RecN